jgi:hypothetical protein
MTSRREAIEAAVAAYGKANPLTPLPRNAARLLVVMFSAEDVCQRSLEDLAGEGFSKNRLPIALRRLVGGLLTRHWVAGVPDLYRLHLPRAQPCAIRTTICRRPGARCVRDTACWSSG